MGVNTDITAPPFKPIAPTGGVDPSGISAQPNIRDMTNDAKKQVSERMAQFRLRMQNNAPQQQPSIPPQTEEPVDATQKYTSAAANLHSKHDLVDRFVDWVLFSR